jgi:hypothetical protein
MMTGLPEIALVANELLHYQHNVQNSVYARYYSSVVPTKHHTP